MCADIFFRGEEITRSSYEYVFVSFFVLRLHVLDLDGPLDVRDGDGIGEAGAVEETGDVIEVGRLDQHVHVLVLAHVQGDRSPEIVHSFNN